MTIANCKQCGRVFQRQYSPLCPPCHQEANNRISQVYRFIQAHPHMTMEEVACSCDVPLKDVEAMLFEGKLGTAATNLVAHCQRCHSPILASRGRFCPSCAEKVETEAGLHEEKQRPKSPPPEPDEARPRKPLTSPEPAQPAPLSRAINDEPAGGHSYGFQRLSES